MGYRRVCIIRKDLHLSAGKLAAMVGHAFEIYWIHKMKECPMPLTRGSLKSWKEEIEPGDEQVVRYDIEFTVEKDMYNQYINGAIVKTICEARNKNHLLRAKEIAESLGLSEYNDFGLIRDNCLTELTPEDEDGRTTVGVWFKPLPDEIAHKISKKYQLYRG